MVHHESLTELYRHGTYKRFHLGDSLLFNCLCSDNSWITWSYSHWLENHATNLCKILKTSWFYSVLGGLFDGSDPMPESAFRQSLERVNENGKFLPSSNLMSSVERIPPNDSYFASKRGFYSFILPLPDGFFVLFVGKNKCHFLLNSLSAVAERSGSSFGSFIYVNLDSHSIHLWCAWDSARRDKLSVSSTSSSVCHQHAPSSISS